MVGKECVSRSLLYFAVTSYFAAKKGKTMRNYKLIKLKAGTLASCQNAHLSSVSSGHWEVVWLKRITRRGLSLSTTKRFLFHSLFPSYRFSRPFFFFSIALLLFLKRANWKETNKRVSLLFRILLFRYAISTSIRRDNFNLARWRFSPVIWKQSLSCKYWRRSITLRTIHDGKVL